MTLIQGPLRRAVADALSVLDVPVVVQKQSEDTEPRAPFVMVETPSATARGDIKQDTGYDLTLAVRVHTRYPKGKADLSKREQLAEAAKQALDPFPEPDGHNVVPIPKTPDTQPVSYEAGGQQAFDFLLQYNLQTQTL
jgi:hypothetical protein